MKARTRQSRHDHDGIAGLGIRPDQSWKLLPEDVTPFGAHEIHMHENAAFNNRARKPTRLDLPLRLGGVLRGILREEGRIDFLRLDQFFDCHGLKIELLSMIRQPNRFGAFPDFIHRHGRCLE